MVALEIPDVEEETESPSRGAVLAVNPQFDVVVHSEDEVRIKQGTWADFKLTLYDDERNGVVGRIFTALLAEARTSEELWAAPGISGRASRQAVDEFVADLLDSGILVTAERAGRGFLDRLGETDARRQALVRATVGIAGDGNTATTLRSYLAEAEIATVPATLLGSASASDVATGDLLVVALDTFSPTVLEAANEVAVQRGTPWVSAYVDGPLVVVGPFYVPGETGCYTEFETQMSAACPTRTELKAYWDGLSTRHAPRPAAPWHSALAASWLVEPIVEYLTTGGCDLVGTATVFDTLQRRTERVRCLALPRCPVCRGDRSGYHVWD